MFHYGSYLFGFGWDDCLKMITVSKDVYDEEVKV